MSKAREVSILVYVCSGLGLYAMFDRFAPEKLPLLILAGLMLIVSFLRIGRRINVPRSLAVIMVIMLFTVLNFAVFSMRVPPEQALVFFLTVLIVAKSFIVYKIRDYGQLMFLSVLSITAAGSHLPTQAFGLIVFAYTIFAGYTLYKLHLLTEALAHRRMHDAMPTLVVGERRHGWFASFLAAGLVTCTLALLIFSFIPRGGPNLSLPDEFGVRGGSTTGFSPDMMLGQMAQTLQDPTPILRLKYLPDRNQKNYNREMYLRGLVLTQYYRLGTNAWKWVSEQTDSTREIPLDPSRSETILTPQFSADRQNLWRITFEQPATNNLFVIDRPVAIRPSHGKNPTLLYHTDVNTLETLSQAPTEKGFAYELLTEPVVNDVPPATRLAASAPSLPTPPRTGGSRRLPPGTTSPATTRLDQRTPLSAEPFQSLARGIVAGMPAKATPEAKAQKIEGWLKSNFGYTLNNTDVDRTGNVEPVMDFLTRRKHGHCEYFAAAMTLLTRALGMDSRIVIGFKGGQYNSFGDYYLVRNLDAHAWVEVYSPTHGWVRYDPTPGARDEFIRGKESTTFKWFWDLVDMMQYSWFDRISNLGKNERQEFMETLQRRTLADTDSVPWNLERIYKKIVSLIKGQDNESVWLQVLHSLVAVLVLIMVILLLRIFIVVGGIVYAALARSLRRRWEERFGSLWFCPVDFYRRVLLWLAGRGMTRTNHETAHEFAARIGEKHPDLDESLAAVTDAYLAVRFGKRSLTQPQRSHINAAAQHIQAALAIKEKAAEAGGNR